METKYLISFVLSVCWLLDFCLAGESKEEKFHVTPGGGTLDVESKVGQFGCTFTYAAQGGTNEEWAISLDVQSDGAQVICTIQRGMSSYIFFEKFSLKITGPGISIQDIEVLTSQRDNKRLPLEEYKLESNSITSVPGKFNNKLEKVAALAVTAREDL